MLAFWSAGFVIRDSDLFIILETPLVLSVTNFSSIPMSPQTMIGHSPPLEVPYLVQPLWSRHPVPCFYNSLIITVLAQLDTNTYINLSTFAPPHSHDYLNNKKISPAVPIFVMYLEQLFISG